MYKLPLTPYCISQTLLMANITPTQMIILRPRHGLGTRGAGQGVSRPHGIKQGTLPPRKKCGKKSLQIFLGEKSERSQYQFFLFQEIRKYQFFYIFVCPCPLKNIFFHLCPPPPSKNDFRRRWLTQSILDAARVL